jgi:hypothetical protein
MYVYVYVCLKVFCAATLSRGREARLHWSPGGKNSLQRKAFSAPQLQPMRPQRYSRTDKSEGYVSVAPELSLWQASTFFFEKGFFWNFEGDALPVPLVPLVPLVACYLSRQPRQRGELWNRRGIEFLLCELWEFAGIYDCMSVCPFVSLSLYVWV